MDYTKLSNMNQRKIDLIDSFDNGKISVYHAGALIKIIGEMFMDMPCSILQSFEEIKKEAEGLLGLMLKVAQEMEKKHTESMNIIEKMWEQQEECYNKFLKDRRSIQAKINELPPLEIPSVYGLEKLLDLAERVGHLTPEQWDRFIKLAEVL